MAATLDYDDFLVHYGIKGMKWGVRKDDNSPSSKVTYKEKKSYEYQKKGLSKSEADVKAARADKIRKTALVVGGTTLASVAAYSAATYYAKNRVGVNLKAGAMLQNVNDVGGSKPQKEGMLYIAYNDHDKKNYRKKYARQISQAGGGKDVYATKLSAIEPIKAPSNAQAKKLYKEYRNSDNRGNYTPKSYAAFNKTFNYFASPEDHKKFSNFMRSKGYNAIIDMNDQNPLYGSKKPTILLDSRKTATVVGHEKISKIMSDKEASQMAVKTFIKQEAKIDSAWAVGIGATVGVVKKNQQRAINKQVDQYFNDHPNSNKTPTEVYMNIFEKQKERR